MRGKLLIIWELVVKSFQKWGDDNAAQWAAALAYYTIFSIPPLLIITISIAGYFLNVKVVQNQVITQIGGFIGTQPAEFVKTLLVNSSQSANGLIASVISIIFLLGGASGAFYQVQRALNTIWKVPPRKSHGFLRTLKNHFLSFLMVLVIAFLLMLFLILSGIISGLINYWNGGSPNVLLPELVNLVGLFIMITILFAMIYRVIPDKEISWTDVWLGAAVTAVLFMLGRYAIGFYLGISKPASAYGAAGSFLVLLLWIYYSAQIFLWGVEFTQLYSMKFGSHSLSKRNN